jgi:hypothetical protein
MFKLPLIIIYAMIAFNITAFTLLLQFDYLIYHSIIAKLVAWVFTVGAWALAYANRKKYIKMF